MPVDINSKEISNDYDRKYMFKREDNYTQTQWTDVENEHFMVWMQMESFPEFIKLYGRVEKEIHPGNYFFEVKSCKEININFIYFSI